MPRVKRKRKFAEPQIQRPKGFYLKREVWYTRIHKPHPKTNVWGMWPESTGHKDLAAAIAYAEKRSEELRAPFTLWQSIDPAKLKMNELFDDLLASLQNEDVRKNYRQVLTANVRPYFGDLTATEVTVKHCQAYRTYRRKHKKTDGEPIKHTTINRELSKVSAAFKIGMKLHKVHSMPPGGCDFWKQPEKENTRLVRLPDAYYEFFRDTIHPALRCFFVLSYNIGRRKGQLLRTRWDQVSFEEKCIIFPATKKYRHPVKAPFFGEIETYLREQKQLRDKSFPGCPFIFFWYATRSDKDGQRIARFDGLWQDLVAALGTKMKEDGLDPIDLHVHDLRRSAHYQMRKAGIDASTRRAIMGHATESMDKRYTIIDDEAMTDAVERMGRYQKRKGMVKGADVAAMASGLSDAEWRKLVALRKAATATPQYP